MPDTQEQVTDEELRKSYWFVTHIMDIKSRIRFGIFAVLALIWIFALASFANLYILQRGGQQRLTESLILATQSFGNQQIPADLTNASVGIVPRSGQTSDLFALIKNPHEQWWADFTYQFLANSTSLGERKGFILPKEEKYCRQLAQNIDQSSSVSFSIVSIQWHRLTTKERRSLAERNRFEAGDFQFTPSSQTGIGFTLPISTFQFSVTNKSPFTFYGVTIPIIAKVGDDIVAVALVPLTSMRGEEKVTRVIQWYHSFADPTSFEIKPYAKILDGSIAE